MNVVSRCCARGDTRAQDLHRAHAETVARLNLRLRVVADDQHAAGRESIALEDLASRSTMAASISPLRFRSSTTRFVLVPLLLFVTPQQLAVLVNCCAFTRTSTGSRPAAIAGRHHDLFEAQRAAADFADLESHMTARPQDAPQLRERARDECLPRVTLLGQGDGDRRKRRFRRTSTAASCRPCNPRHREMAAT